MLSLVSPLSHLDTLEQREYKNTKTAAINRLLNNKNFRDNVQHHHTPSVRTHTTRSSCLPGPADEMAFCFLSGSCILSVWEAGFLLLEVALEERAILAVPSAMDVFSDYLTCCNFVREMIRD